MGQQAHQTHASRNSASQIVLFHSSDDTSRCGRFPRALNRIVSGVVLGLITASDNKRGLFTAIRLMMSMPESQLK